VVLKKPKADLVQMGSATKAEEPEKVPFSAVVPYFLFPTSYFRLRSLFLFSVDERLKAEGGADFS
jgi:hypothetical protein